MELIHAFYGIVFIFIIKELNTYLTHTLTYWKKRGLVGPTPLPLLGDILEILLKPLKELEEENLNKYGRIYGSFRFSQPLLTIADPRFIREIAIKQFHHFRNRHNLLPGDEFMAKTLFFADDDDWRSLRSIINPAFATKKLKNIFVDIEKCAQNAIDYLMAFDSKELAIKEFVARYATRSLLQSVFGCDANPDSHTNDLLIKDANFFTKFITWRMFALIIPSKLQIVHPLFKFSAVPTDTRVFYRKLLKSSLESRKKNGAARNSFIDVLLKHEEIEETDDTDLILTENSASGNLKKATRKKLGEEDISAQCFVFLLAGIETSSTILNFAIYTLAMNPNIQERLYNEIKSNFDQQQKFDYDSFNSLTYLEAFMNEILRLYTPIVFVDRIASEDVVLGENELIIEKGTTVKLPLYAVMHDPLLFPEPYEFKPERFLPENRHLIQPYSFIPFGVGPRNCVGMRFALMNTKLFLAHILLNFQVLKSKMTPLKPKYKVNNVALDAEPLYVKIVSRNN